MLDKRQSLVAIVRLGHEHDALSGAYRDGQMVIATDLLDELLHDLDLQGRIGALLDQNSTFPKATTSASTTWRWSCAPPAMTSNWRR